ncbi:hypothetical protein, partial [Vibrio cholerae]|uniref:hypothetical protein n=1 Tax=Vibrio cholerae TaxID=666 RepID=UPI0018F07B7D
DLVARPAQWEGEGEAPKIVVEVPRAGRRSNRPAPGLGDRALIRVSPDREAPGRYTGRVVKVIGKNRAEVIGVYRAGRDGGRLLP